MCQHPRMRMAMISPRSRLLVRLLVPLLIAVLLGALLASSPRLRESIPQAMQRAAAIPLTAWLLAIAGFGLSYLSRATRLWLEWRTVSTVNLPTMLRVAVQHNAAVHLLPMRVGEIAYPMLMKRHAGASLTDSALSLVTLRLQDLIVVLALAVLLLWPGAGALALLAAGAAAFAVLQPRLQRWRPQGPRLARLADALRRSRAGHLGWLLVLASWSLKIAVVAMLLAELTGLPALTALRGAMGGELAAGMPVQGPAGFGGYEASMLAALILDLGTGVDTAALAAAAFVVHLVIFGIACVAGLLGWIHDFVISGREYVGP